MSRNWDLVDTEVDGETMTIRHTPKDDAVWFAYFPPYPAYRMEDKLKALAEYRDEVTVYFYGHSVLGQQLLMIRLGTNCAGGCFTAVGDDTACRSCCFMFARDTEQCRCLAC